MESTSINIFENGLLRSDFFRAFAELQIDKFSKKSVMQTWKNAYGSNLDLENHMIYFDSPESKMLFLLKWK